MSTSVATPNGETKLPWTTCVMGCVIKASSEVTLLKCFHSICSDSCVERFKSAVGRGQNVTCVNCKSAEHAFKSSKKIEWEKFFPKKKIMMEPLRCEFCAARPPAKAFCNQCDHFLCKGCAEVHSAIKIAQNHVLEYANMEAHRREICELENHNRSPLLYYCHKCDTKFCWLCASDHVGHAAFVFQRERQDFDSKMIAAKDFVVKCNKVIEGLVTNHHRFEADDWMVAETYLARKCARLSENRREEEYKKRKSDLKKVFDSVCTNIVRKIKCVKNTRQLYQDFLAVASDISENGDDVAVVNFLRFCGKKDDGNIEDSWILNVTKHSQGIDGILEADCKFMKEEELAKFKAEVERVTDGCKNLATVPQKPLEDESPDVTENYINQQTLSKETPKEDTGTKIKNISTSKRCDHDGIEVMDIADNPRSHSSKSENSGAVMDDFTSSQLSNSNVETEIGIDTTHDAVAEDGVNPDQTNMGNSEIRSRPRRSCGFKADPNMIYVPLTLGGNFGIGGTGTMSTKKVEKKSSDGKVKPSKKEN